MCVRKNRCRVRCVFVCPQKPLQSELCFCASTKTGAEFCVFLCVRKNCCRVSCVSVRPQSYLGACTWEGFGRVENHTSEVIWVPENRIWGSKFVPAGFLRTRGGKWYLGAGKSYLGGPRGLEIRISGVFSGPSGGKSFLGGGKSYWGALLGTRKSYLGVSLASGLETGT